MFQGLRFRLLLSYLSVMAAILFFFSLWVYISRFKQESDQIDQKLESIAQIVAPYFAQVENQGSLNMKQVEQIYGYEQLNLKQQSLEWFNYDKQLIASQGELKLPFPPQTGKTGKRFLTIDRRPFPIRTYTYSVVLDNSSLDRKFLVGYVRISQPIENIETIKNELLWQLGTGTIIALGLAGIGGFWLTKKALIPVEQSYQQLKQFTADASHELRNPLTAISMSIEVMLNHPERIHPKDGKKLAAIANATEQMIHLTEDLLFLARTEGTVSIAQDQWHPVSLNQVLENLVELLEPVAEDKAIALEYHSLAVLSVMGDNAQLSRLFANLLQNSIQYTPEKGRVILSLSQQNRLAVISVKDTGIGIDKEHLPHIFSRFWRADKARSRRAGGTGLGLSIVQAIAHRHGGKITVHSQIGVGSCFTVSLPVNS